MKKVLVINSNRYGFPRVLMPIGAAYVASSLKKHGFTVKFLDLNFSRNILYSLVKEIRLFQPDIVGVSIRNIASAGKTTGGFYLQDLRNVFGAIMQETDAKIVIGGPAVTIMPREIMDFLKVKYAICGDGEEALPKLLKSLASGEDIAGIDGIVFSDGLKNIINPPARAQNLDQLALARIYNWIDYKRYSKEYIFYPIQTKRGCLQECLYCVYNKIEGKEYRLRSAESVADEIEEVIKACHPRRIEIIDANFNAPLEHALEVLRKIIKRKFKVKFKASNIHPKWVTKELIKLLEEAGFQEVSCSLESGDSKILNSLGKNFNLSDIKNAARLFSQSSISVIWSFLFGAPGEDRESIRQTFNFIEKNIRKTDLVSITCGIHILKGAPIEDRAKECKQISAKSDLLHPVWFQPETITSKEMAYLINKEIAKHANYASLDDTASNKAFVRSLRKLYGLVDFDRPIWQDFIRAKSIGILLGSNYWKVRRLKRDFNNYSG